MSHRVLLTLAAELLPRSARPADATAVGRAFIALLAARERQARALAAFDQLADSIVSSADPEPSFISAQASAASLADEIADLASAALISPAEQISDLRLKLAVLIAASEPHPDDAYTFPGLYLRVLMADLNHGFPPGQR
ncbi:hypothetical protein ASG60_18365 [Methylobacterium sp. Leaf469]|uniref:hypothetical protein n=1 Tax=Methylobacterium sp. Leaf469 TaxID=1736387 RepID=UPI000701675A|nr:hypothetical protein [Methylobacterium sp. Leaf469]KQU01815.1 hypothetical protein ASG60_18365 [Methylobacterium sp. Leaf469]